MKKILLLTLLLVVCLIGCSNTKEDISYKIEEKDNCKIVTIESDIDQGEAVVTMSSGVSFSMYYSDESDLYSVAIPLDEKVEKIEFVK